MSETTARICIPLRNGVFEVSGSEAFVSAQIDAFRDVIDGLLAETSPTNAESPRVRGEAAPESPIEGSASSDESDGGGGESGDYQNVYDITDGNVRILVDKMPGTSMKEQTVNAALLYTFGKQLVGTQEVSTNEIRNICKEFGCLDSSNFMGYLRDAKRLLLISGSGRTFNAKLTGPGRAQAKILVKQVSPS